MGATGFIRQSLLVVLKDNWKVSASPTFEQTLRILTQPMSIPVIICLVSKFPVCIRVILPSYVKH